MTPAAHRTMAVGMLGVVLAGLALGARLARMPLRGEVLGQRHMVMQRTSSDCGLAAIATMVVHAGKSADDYEVMLRRYPVPPRGFTLARLAAIADDLGVSAEPWRLAPGALDTIALPAVLHLGDKDHYVVLLERAPVWLVADPAIGMLRTTRDDVRRVFSGAALVRRARTETPPRI